MADNALTIQMPRQGIAQSPHVGFGDVRNLDLYTLPGVARLNKKLSLNSGTVASAPKWIVRSPNVAPESNASVFYALGTNGTLMYSSDGLGTTWKTIGGNPVTNVHGNGLEIWKDWAVVARDAFLDFYGPLSATGSTAIFGAIAVSTANPMVISCDNVHNLSIDDRVTLWSTGQITSSGSVAFANTGTAYYVRNANANGDGKAFTLAAAPNPSGAELSTAGGTVSGTHYFRVWKSGSIAEGSGTPTTPITSDNLFHPLLVSKLDGKLYGGAGNQILKMSQVTTFNPFDSSTYTFTTSALTTALPSDYRIKCLAELGSNLMIGTWKGTTVTDFPIADIFPWDTTSTALGNPIIINDYGVHALKTFGSYLIIWAGVNGRIYRSDGVNFSEVARLPMDVTSAEYVIWSPGAVAIYKGRIFFGTGNVSSALPGQGVYSLQFTSKENILVLEHTNSQETDGSSESTVITALCPITGDTILAGFSSGGSVGIDHTTTGNYAYTTAYLYQYFDTPLYVVGTKDNKRKFTQVSFLFAKPLATGEGIRISYRTNLNASFTTMGTWTKDVAGTTQIGAAISFQDTPKITDTTGQMGCEMVQFRVALLGTTTTTPQLKQVRFE